MTMYLSNREIHPTGDEAGEFIEVPPAANDTTAEVRYGDLTGEPLPVPAVLATEAPGEHSV